MKKQLEKMEARGGGEPQGEGVAFSFFILKITPKRKLLVR
jgi:hypothetical protein